MSSPLHTPPGSPAPAPEGPPHGVTLIDHAEISAEIAEGDRSQIEILRARDLTEAQWIQATMHWMTRMGDDVRVNSERARLALAYSDAFGRAQDKIRAVPPMDVGGYAALVVEIQRAGDPARPLALRNLSSADHVRLSRHFARVLSSDPDAAAAFFAAYQALQPKSP